jgi:polyketide synthase 13
MFSDKTVTAKEIEAFIASWLVRNAELTSSDIRSDRALTDYGLDSLLSVQLSEGLQNLLGRSLSPSLAWEFTTIGELAAHLSQGGSGTQEDLDA